MFVELVKGQTAIVTEMKVRNNIDKCRMEMEERREIRTARFTWGVLMIAAFALGVNGIEYLMGMF